MAWKLEGTYFENCNCDWVCPCTVTSFASPATGDRCQVILNYHVRRGEIDGVEVGGPMANIAPLIGEILGIERLPIEYSDKGNRHSIRIGDDVAIEVEDYAAQEGGETTK